ncbi:1347_t:CDS:2 [Ambispora leptoticha]|uniref:1347_t:CDS:1 n=1 Tax=Ambispora leptoticha TaxID=144679 RepID=A0A9N9A077_9GLOM|nr:1347_t:CDS:2 [Ambispora leptoticha]
MNLWRHPFVENLRQYQCRGIESPQIVSHRGLLFLRLLDNVRPSS